MKVDLCESKSLHVHTSVHGIYGMCLGVYVCTR